MLHLCLLLFLSVLALLLVLCAVFFLMLSLLLLSLLLQLSQSLWLRLFCCVVLGRGLVLAAVVVMVVVLVAVAVASVIAPSSYRHRASRRRRVDDDVVLVAVAIALRHRAVIVSSSCVVAGGVAVVVMVGALVADAMALRHRAVVVPSRASPFFHVIPAAAFLLKPSAHSARAPCATMRVLMLVLALSWLTIAKGGPPKNAAHELIRMLGTGADVTPTLDLAESIAAGRYQRALMESLGKIARKNKYTYNYERGLERWFRIQDFRVLTPDTYDFPVIMFGKSMLALKRVTQSCLLPHEWFGALHAFPDLFADLFTGGDANLRHFGERSRDSDWYQKHPVIPSAPLEMLIPLGLHGDDVGVYRKEKVLVMTWGPLAVGRHVLDTRLIFTGIFVKSMVPDVTWDEIQRVLTWSFKCLAMGTYPAADHNGKPFAADHHPARAALANQVIAGGYLGVWGELRGDWKYLREALGLAASFATAAHVCHLCYANKKKRRLYYTQTRRSHWTLRRTLLSHRGFLRRQRSFPGNTTGPMYDLPGFHIWQVWVDPLHAMDLGILQKLSASTLLELTDRRYEPYSRSTRTHRLLQAHEQYKEWCRAKGEQAVPPFNDKSWYAHGDYPEMTMKCAKGAQQRALQYWFLEKCQEEAVRAPSVHSAVRLALWMNLVRVDMICASRLADTSFPCAGRFLSASEVAALQDSMEEALDCYVWLANDAVENGIKRWKTQPQMHMLTHMAYDMAGQANPRRVHCYADEDMVGRFKTLVSACHPRRASSRSLLRYSIMLSFRWWLRVAELRGLLDLM